MRILELTTFLALLALCQCQTIVQQVCSSDRQMTTIQPGADVIIGGLFEMRAMGTNGSGCGRPLSDTMQIFESARYAVNFLNSYNNGNGYVSGVKFGMDAYDTCLSSSSALNVLQKLYPQTTSSNPFCTSSNRVIAGVLGSLSSWTTIPAAALASQLPISIISPSATAPELSDKFRYPTFLRTVPSYAVFAKVIVELLQQIQWQNILVIYTDEIYGQNGYEQLLMAMYSHGLCVSKVLIVDPNGNKDSYKIALSAIGAMSSPVAVLITPNMVTKVILQAVDEMPSLAGMQWILSDIDITNDVSSLRRVRGAMVVVPRSPTVDEFRQYFTQLEAAPRNNVGNPWFEDWFEEIYSCSLVSNNCPTPSAAQFIQSPWTVPTMKAVFAYAEAVRSICQGSSGLCSGLTTMTSTEFNSVLQRLNFTLPPNFPVALRGQKIKFDANGDPETSDFTVYNYNNRQGNFMFEEIGRFESNTFTLVRQPTLYDSTRNTILTTNTMATCAALGCENCLLPRRSVTYRYKSGDLVIASLINAHEPGRAPFTCGTGRASHLAALVAAEWAVSQYKANNPTQLQQVTLGSLVADICPDSAVAQGFLTDLLGGNNQLVDSFGSIIPYNNIQAFVDETSSDQAAIISPIISEYNIPEVVTSVTTAMLSHGGNTPYFTRAVPSDEIIYSAISSLLQRLGWNYIQVATHKSGEYREMSEAFTRVAARYGICVVGMAGYFGDGMMDPYNRTVVQLLSNRETQIVVVFGSMMDIQGLLGAIGQRGVNSQLQLIAGIDSWGTNPSYIQGFETVAGGAIVFDLEMSSNVAFNTYLQSLTLAQIAVHPFVRELFEITNQCAVDPASQGIYTRICSSADTFRNIYQGRVPYIVQSINAVASKLHEVIAEACGASYSSLCSEFRAIIDIGSRLNTKLADISKSNGFGIKNGDSITDIIFYVYSQGWQRFTQFSTESRTLASVNTATLGNYQSKLASCSGVCMDCQYLFTMQTSIYNAGDWLIAGAFGVSNSGPEKLQPYICGDVKTSNGPQFTMAMMYALQQVNSDKFPISVRGVKFGGLVLDHCGNPGRAGLMMSDIYAGFMSKMNVDQTKILAWMTDTDMSTNETVQILDSLNVATVSPSATADSLMKYQTFFRTIQGDSAAASALISIVKAMKYNYVQVVYSTDNYGQEGIRLLMAASQAQGICITNQIEFKLNTSDVATQLLAAQTRVVILFMGEAETDAVLSSVTSNPNGASSLLILMPKPYRKIVQRVGSLLRNPVISLELQRFNLSDYKAYINNSPITNPFFAKYYMKIRGCNVPGYSIYNTSCVTPLQAITSLTDYEEDIFVLSTIDAVYSVVDALHRTVSEYCGSNYTKPCSSFLAAPDKRQRFNRNLNNVNFVDDGKRSFRFLVREGATTFSILQSNSSGAYIPVGSYSGQNLDFTDAAISKYSSVVSACSAPCLGCIMKGLNFSFTEGDIYLAGMFDVHERSLSPFTCGDIKTLHGFLLLEAFHYALEQVNAKEGQFANILHGTRLGGVGLDACGSDVRGGYIISNIHSGIVTLAKESTIIYPSLIDAYIGSYASTASIYIARILTDLQIPQISYGAGSEDLSDQRVYPYFYRTVPTDNDLVEAMLQLMDKLNIRYVQVLYEDNSNGISAKNRFVQRAANYSICVAEVVAYTDLGIVSQEITTAVVSKLIEKPAANTVVTFLSTAYINSILRTIGTSVKAKNQFRFIGSNAWADNEDAILGTGNQAAGSITTRLDANDIEAFENYINSKNLANSKDNPWFEEYFQRILGCYISKTNTMGYPVPCPSNQVSLISSTRYQQDSDVVYVMNAVYASAFALHKTLMDVCGANYTAVCQAYRTNSNRHSMTRDNLASVSFTDPAGKDFMFVNRSGLASYRFNAIIPGVVTNDARYRQIGSYNRTNGIIDLTNIIPWNSDCNRPDACAECPAIRDSGLRYVFHKSSQSMGTTIVAFFDIHKQGVDPYRCGNISVEGFQQLLTFFYALDNVIPNRNYRILAIDTCSNSLRVDQDLYGLLDGTGLCNSQFNNANPVSIKNIGSVITVGELNTVAASRVLELPKITYLSPNALSTFLDDKQHLVRTVAPISAMMKTLVSLLNKLGWTYVDVVYEDSSQGVDPFQSFASFANMAKVCRGSNLKVPAGATLADVENLLSRLNGNKGSNAVVLLGSYNFVKVVLAAASAMSVAERYVWILGVEWDLTTDAMKDLVPVGVELRFITVRRLNYMVGSFNAYMNSLTYARVHAPNTDVSFPQDWFDEFYQLVFDCTLSNAAKPINVNKMMCNTSMQFSSLNWMQDVYTLNTIAATYAVITGLNNCGGMCSMPLNNDTVRMNVLQNILNVQWNINANTLQLSNQETPPVLQFDKDNRWWDSGYLIKYIRVKNNTDGTLTTNENELVHGDFNPIDEQISKMKAVVAVNSVCTESDACSCTYEEIDKPQPLIAEPFKPSEPRNYYYYHSNGQKQYEWPIWAIVVAIITSVGLLANVILFLILIFAYPVRGGTSVLGYMSIIGIIGIYVINFAFFVHANDATCGARRFVMGVVYMIAIAPLLIKAIDNWRFGFYSDEKQRYSGISSSLVLLLAALAVVLIQCIIPIIWLILVHPTASEWKPFTDARHDNWWCDPPETYDTGLVQSFIFVMFIVLVTAVFSAMSFDNDRNNYESRWILFSCIVTAGCFLVWMIVSTSAGPPFRDPAVAIGNLVNATLLLLALPLRKCVLLCKHLRNKEREDDALEVLNNGTGNGHMNMYNDSYDNPMILYDNQFGANMKPSEY